MRFDILTLFPEMFDSPLNQSILKRAREQGLISITIHNIRDYATDKHRITDDMPYGGGGGMVMKPEPIFHAVEAILGDDLGGSVPVILLSPQGRLLTQSIAHELAGHSRIMLICGRYEGVDERVREFLVDDEISVGDYVLTGGEIPAMIIVDAVSRLVPGVLGDPTATLKDSHAQGLLEHPQYTRPPVFRGRGIPEALLSGHHAEIALWRRRQALRRTYERRPDLLEKAELTEEDLDYLESLERENS
ncbi:MAG: tRNA (guanosine(37)-N1)-methyltransferase TrmD [Anaerolineae bacterium]|nr:tRNA (guanosine(37)-N1)-methyltransferase TrmD [Anaerolineae bacterium]NIN97085.1 tRNA (guanosine(37)-N1)-methyltransferase TrmD [Anaerolineae bacterium]NIQ80033.1 tRNA (guanosine(37)-N1)-methyltransferase TrmD [Anaerolineae bacterium]